MSESTRALYEREASMLSDINFMCRSTDFVLGVHIVHFDQWLIAILTNISWQSLNVSRLSNSLHVFVRAAKCSIMRSRYIRVHVLVS